MSSSIFFAGGGTGGHIYPAIAVAEQIAKIEPQARIHFFISSRDIDAQVLSKTDFEYTVLPARGFSVRPDKLFGFCTAFLRSCSIAEKIIARARETVVVGTGGFVAAPVCWTARKLKVPVVLVNVDVVPGRANKIIARWAKEIFVQFERTARYFTRTRAKIDIVGCPLRQGFDEPQPNKAIEQSGLDRDKKILLITGASSGSANVNRTICSLLGKLSGFAEDWQIVHLTGRSNFESVKLEYAASKIRYKVLDYCDDMADLLAAADLVIGRSGAVSVGEYAAAGAPSICMPYPYHKDMHQYLNAGSLVEAGAAVIVDDVADEKDRAEWLWEELEPLLKDDEKRDKMREACKAIAKKGAALKIAQKLLEIA